MSEKGIIEFTGTLDVRKESPIDPRTRQETFARLLLAATWTQGDGLLYRPNGLTILVYGDTEARNGYYFLPKNLDYSVADNWVKVAAGDGFKVLDIAAISELDTMSLEQGIYLVRGAVYGQLTVVDMVSEEVSYFGELSDFNCTKEEIFYTGELSSFDCVKALNLKLNLITASFESHAVTVHSGSPVASPVAVLIV
jgi:hypothetical protein